MDMLADHRINYKKHYDQRQAEYTTAKWDHESVVEEMKAATIKCVKYNYSLDAGVQNFMQFDGLIKLSPDGKKLVITLKKYSETPIHVTEPDPHTVKRMREHHKKTVRRNTQKLKQSIKSKMEEEDKEGENQKKLFEEAQPDRHSVHSDDEPPITKDEEEELPAYDEEAELDRIKDRYNFTESSTTCNISDIQGIIYGGFSSRFWIYRKHLCCLDYDILMKDTKRKKFRGGKTELPFYAW